MGVTADGEGTQQFAGSLLDQLRMVGAANWWETPTAVVIVDIAQATPFVVALAGVTEVLQAGKSATWVCGGDTPSEAFEVVHEWLEAGIDPPEVAGWLRAGCWDPRAAKRMVDAGLRPARLLEEGEPVHLVDVGPDGEIPVALAVADSYITVADAVKTVTRPRDSGAA